MNPTTELTTWLDNKNLKYQLLRYPNEVYSIRIPFGESQGSMWIDFDNPKTRFVNFLAIIPDATNTTEWLTTASETIPSDFDIITNKIKEYL